MHIDFDGSVAVVTGASSGIGAALAVALSARGASVVLAARNRERLDAVARQCTGPVEVVATDVTRREEVQRLFDEARNRFGRVDLWINNAGRGITARLEDLTDEDVDAMMSVNLKSALYGMQTVLPHFKDRGTGTLVNVSSMLALVPMAPLRSAYSAAKAALNAIAGGLRLELAESHPDLRVVTVMPGIVATDFGNHARHGGEDSRALPGGQSVDEVVTAILRGLEEGREEIYTRPEGVTPVLRYLEARSKPGG
ncbi:MAG TPA: SDR family NAD(P)-dependent oxidoreductase [Myxococcaceae bacterium]|nr:SDR family NAD(P)-dependent oxidoreductase [Myxococcaceae bacterium]